MRTLYELLSSEAGRNFFTSSVPVVAIASAMCGLTRPISRRCRKWQQERAAEWAYESTFHAVEKMQEPFWCKVLVFVAAVLSAWPSIRVGIANASTILGWFGLQHSSLGVFIVLMTCVTLSCALLFVPFILLMAHLEIYYKAIKRPYKIVGID